MGGGGALGVEASDLVDDLGLVVPVFERQAQDEINKRLPEFGKSAKNPVDTGNPLIPADPLVEIMRIIAARDTIDAIFVVQLLFHSQVLMRRVAGQAESPLSLFAHHPRLAEGAGEISKASGKPIIAVLPRTSTLNERRGPGARSGAPPGRGRLPGGRVRRLPDDRPGASGFGARGEVSGVSGASGGAAGRLSGAARRSAGG